MFGRPLRLAGVLLAAMGVPYLVLDDQLAQMVQTQFQRLTGGGKPAETDPLAVLNEPAKQPAEASAKQPAAASQPAAVPLAEALRFDVTPEWVTARWPRVTSVTGDADHLGLRVVLVSGTETTDVAGSLTYYFDQKHHAQRITLLGVTGDESQLVALACGHFGLRPTQTLDRGLYYGGDPNTPTSSLRVANLPVVKAEATHARVQVALDLARADVSKLKTEEERPGKILPQAYRRW